jgi:hypothetical protein
MYIDVSARRAVRCVSLYRRGVARAAMIFFTSLMATSRDYLLISGAIAAGGG